METIGAECEGKGRRIAQPLSTGEGNRSSWWSRARLLLGVAVSVGSLALLLWNIDWYQSWAALQGADYRWLVPSLATVAVAVWLKVLKWQLLLRPAGETSRLNLLYSMSVGYLVNTVLPGRLGELARVYMVARLDGISPGAVLSTVAVDRILDVVMLALLLGLVLPTAELPPLAAQSGLLVGAGGVALLAVSVLLAYPTGQRVFLGLLARSPSFPGKALIKKLAEELCLGMQGLRGAGPQLRIAAATVGIWLVSIFTFYFGQLAFHIQAPLWAAVLVLVMTNLGMVVPSTPGYLGVYQLLVVLALGPFGVEKEVAFGFGLVIHLVGLLPVALMGAFSLWRCGLTLTGWRESDSPAIPDQQPAKTTGSRG